MIILGNWDTIETLVTRLQLYTHIYIYTIYIELYSNTYRVVRVGEDQQREIGGRDVPRDMKGEISTSG